MLFKVSAGLSKNTKVKKVLKKLKEEKKIILKGSLTRDFRLQFFFLIQCIPGPLSIPLGSFLLFLKIRRDNREWMFISGVNDTGDKLFGGVNNTADKFIGGVVDTSD